MPHEKKIELVFPEATPVVSEEGGWVSKSSGGSMKHFVTTIDDISNWFEKFKIDSIELWISAGIETGQVVRLFIGAKGEGGLKVTLKPRSS